MEDSESKSSTNDSFVNKDDLRVESVTPRNATSHSRQTSISSVNSITSKLYSKILAQWLSGRMLDWRPKCGGFEPH